MSLDFMDIEKNIANANSTQLAKIGKALRWLGPTLEESELQRYRDAYRLRREKLLRKKNQRNIFG